MKHCLLFITLLAFVSCQQPAKNSYKEDKDRLSVLVQEGLLHNDSAKLQQALLLSDSLLSIDTVSSDRYLLFHTQASVYAALGDVGNSMDSEEKAVLMMPADNIDRLAFFHNRLLWGVSNDLLPAAADGGAVVTQELLQDGTWQLVSPFAESKIGTFFKFGDGQMEEILQIKNTGEKKSVIALCYLSDLPVSTFNKEQTSVQGRGKFIVFEHFPTKAYNWRLLRATINELTVLSQAGDTLLLRKI